MFHYAMLDKQDPLKLYNRLIDEAEQTLDPSSKPDFEEHPQGDWYRST